MTRTNKIIYWISTLWLASGMLATGMLQLFKAKAEGALAPPGVYGITHLGYPIYFLTILGVENLGSCSSAHSQVSSSQGMGLCRFFLYHVGSGVFAYRSGRFRQRIGSLIVVAGPDCALLVFPT